MDAFGSILSTFYEADYRIVLPDDTVKYHHAFGRPVVNRSGDPIEFGGTTIQVRLGG
jgi:hypothetical protein